MRPADDLIPYQLAYDASIRAIEDQARVLESLRSRPGTLLAATALRLAIVCLVGEVALWIVVLWRDQL
jgi:hypothetical protein